MQPLWQRDTLFWPAWSILTVAAAICTALLARQSAYPATSERNAPHKLPFRWSGRTVIPLCILACFLGGYVAMILIGEDFACYDNSLFTAYSLRGLQVPVQIWPQGGRFFPIALQEFNLIAHFAKTPAGYQAFPIAEVLALVSILLILDDRLNTASRAILASLALLVPSVIVCVTGLIYSERNLLLLLPCLALFVKLFEQTGSPWWAVAAIACSQVMLYLKEPVFLLLLGFALSRLILRCWNANHAGWDFHRLQNPESRLDFCIAAVSLIFLAFYGFVMFPYSSAQYLVEHRTSLSETVKYYLRVDLLVWFFAVVFVVRMYRVLRGSAVPILLWDGLACGGVVYFAAHLALKMAHPYYLAPADLIAVLYLGHLLFPAWAKMRPGFRAATAALVVIVVGQMLPLSGFRVLERKYFIRQKAALARMILERYQHNPGVSQKLYFPFTSAFSLAEFASYLSYRGLPVEEDHHSLPGRNRVEIFGAKITRDGPCVSWHDFLCHAGVVDARGLAIVLPEDHVPPSEWQSNTEIIEKLRSYDSRTQAPEWCLRVLRPFWSELKE